MHTVAMWHDLSPPFTGDDGKDDGARRSVERFIGKRGLFGCDVEDRCPFWMT